jgi:uncharacterized membrane protein
MTMTTTNLSDKVRDELVGELRNLASAFGERAVQAVTERLTDATARLGEYAGRGGGPGLLAAATGAQRLAEGQSPVKAMLHAGLAGGKEKMMSALGGGRGKGGQRGQKLKVVNIVEAIDVGVPVRVAYNQWTQFRDFPSLMKKVEQAQNESDEKMTWKAQVFWSHRSWESTIVRQIPDRLIHWRSKGEKGSVDGTVSFHSIGSDLTRILVVLEYHPQGLFERTGNLWRAQGRRARLELKHFVRHVMTQTVLDPESVEGWRGEIEDSEVVKDHETALREEREADERPERDRADEAEDAEEGDTAEGDTDEGDNDDGDTDEADEYDEDDHYDDEDDEEPEPAEERPPPRRQPARARRPAAERESRVEPERRRAPRRASDSSRGPVVRRRQEERER